MKLEIFIVFKKICSPVHRTQIRHRRRRLFNFKSFAHFAQVCAQPRLRKDICKRCIRRLHKSDTRKRDKLCKIFGGQIWVQRAVNRTGEDGGKKADLRVDVARRDDHPCAGGGVGHGGHAEGLDRNAQRLFVKCGAAVAHARAGLYARIA